MEHRGRGWYWLVDDEYVFLGDGLRAVIANMYDQEWLDDHELPMPKPQEHTLITQPPWKSTSQCTGCGRLTRPHPENGRFWCRFCDLYTEPRTRRSAAAPDSPAKQ